MQMTQTMQPIHSTAAITMTPAAIEKVQEILKQQGEEAQNLGLRVFVAGGGCSGLQYGMTLDEMQEADTVIPIHDVKVLVDEMSLGYVSGSEIDYVDSLMGAGFQVKNPNAVSTCGCGHSFKTANSSESAPGASCGSCH